MDKNKLKEVLKTIVTEESEYKEFFKRALEKAGKSIPSMSDEEKKAFFNKIDTAWQGKGEKKNEGQSVNEKSSDPFLDFGRGKGTKPSATKRVDRVAKYGNYKFEFDDRKFIVTLLYKEKQIAYGFPDWITGGYIMNHLSWGASEKKFQSLEDIIKYFKLKKITTDGLEAFNENEVPGRVPSQIKAKLDKAVDQIKGSNLTYPQRLKVLSHVMDGLGIDKKELTKMTTKLKGTLESTVNEDDLDVGHTDDEPNMLKSTALEIAQYGAKLVEKLDQYDNMNQEVDFPNWWQAKLILAKDYVHGAYHYLDSNETLGEGRAFINAAKKAKSEGKTEFEFNGKTYPVTIKD
jgi:hypothetical protein